MNSRLKPGKGRSPAPKHGARTIGRRAPGTALEAWEQTAQVPDEREDEIDCQRIVQGDDGRRLPLYYDDFN